MQHHANECLHSFGIGVAARPARFCLCRQPRRIYINEKTEHIAAAQPGWVAAHAFGNAAGICALEPTSHLSMHSIYGSWFSLRCVLVFDDVAYTVPQPEALPPVELPADRQDAVQRAKVTVGAWRARSCCVLYCKLLVPCKRGAGLLQAHAHKNIKNK